MTTSVSTRSPGRLNPTRQQLDELDALLQRMLDLPVNPLDEPEQAEVEEPDDEPPLPAANLGERQASSDWSIAQEPADEPSAAMNFGEQPASDDWFNLHQPAEAERAPFQPAAQPARPPVSYMVVETASPRPLPPASGFEPRPSIMAPRLVPVTPPPEPPVEIPATSEEQTSPHSSLFTPPGAPLATEPTVQEPDAGEMWVPLRSTWQPSPQTWPPLAESWHQANGGARPLTAPGPIPSPRLEPTPPAPVGAASRAAPEVRRAEPDLPPALTEEASLPALPERTPVSAEPQLSLSAEDAPPAVPAALLPLLWFNQGFDACLAPLGAPGRWLCERGRPVLGFIGLACLAAAAAIAISAGMAWTW
jgi:hypothetical protein